MTQKKKNNIIIGSLCAVVLLMAVGYAAFSSILNIKGTTNISSNWKVLITNVESKNIVGAASNAEEPSWEDLTATFKTNLVSPGDSIEYDITVENRGNLNAVLEKITVSDSNNPAIKFTTSGLTEGDPLTANGGTAKLTVKVEYDNAVTSQPNNLKSDLTVTLDYVQEGTSTVVPGGDTFTGTVYRYTTDKLNIGDSIEGIEITTDPSILGKNHYLKHDVVDNKITVSYVCFVTGSEHCMQGGKEYYETNKALLQSQEAWFTSNGGRCYDSGSLCYGGGFSSVNTESLGNVKIFDDSTANCYVSSSGSSSCSKSIS